MQILSSIFKHLTISELKVCRFVCKTWEDEAMKSIIWKIAVEKKSFVLQNFIRKDQEQNTPSTIIPTTKNTNQTNKSLIKITSRPPASTSSSSLHRHRVTKRNPQKHVKVSTGSNLEVSSTSLNVLADVAMQMRQTDCSITVCCM